MDYPDLYTVLNRGMTMHSAIRENIKRIAFGLGAAMLLVAAFAASATAQERISERKSVQADGLVKVTNIFGSVRVSGWDRNEVSVEGTLGEGTKELQFTVEGGETEIKVVLPTEAEKRARGIEKVRESDLEIRIPAGSTLEVETVTADITTSELSGNLDLHTVTGKVDVVGSPSNVRVESMTGDIDIDSPQGPVRASTVSGRITIKEASGRVDAESIAGQIKVAGKEIEEVNISCLSGHVYFEDDLVSGAIVHIENHSGNVTLTLSEDVSADFDISTFSGSIKNEFGPEAERTGRFGPGRVLSFVTGSGDARVRVKLFSGNVVIEKK